MKYHCLDVHVKYGHSAPRGTVLSAGCRQHPELRAAWSGAAQEKTLRWALPSKVQSFTYFESFCLFFTTCSMYKRLSLIVFCNCNWCLVVSADGIPQQRNPQDFLTPRASPSQDEVPQRPTQGSVFREKTTDLKHAGLELLPVPCPKVLPLNQTTAPNLSCLSVVHESDRQQDEWARVCWKTDLDRLVP